MAYIINNAGLWRSSDQQRPWYSKAWQLLPAPGKLAIVEFGSGAGEFARRLKARFDNLTCLDISPVYIRQLTHSGYKAITADFNQHLPLAANRFSGAVALEVIEHVVQAELFLKEVRRILKPGGWLVLSTPNIAWWGYRLMAVLGRPPKKEGYHFRFFTAKTLVGLLKESGFSVEKSASFTTIPGLNRLLIWLKFKPIYPNINFWPNFLAQDLVFLCRKK